MKDDEELMRAWRAGDREAGEALFARHFDAVYDFFASKVGGDVADLVQRTFLGFVAGKERFRGECSPRTYLYAIARHELYRCLRLKRRDECLDFGVTSLAELGTSPSALADRRGELGRLLEALEGLPLELQLLLEMRFWRDLTMREIALVLDVPPGTVASRFRRAFALLKDALAPGPGMAARILDDDALERWARSLRRFDSAS